MDNDAIKAALVTAATRYDRAQSTRKGYNVYALAQYLMRLDEVADEVASGRTWREAIEGGFNDRLRDALLAALPA